MKSYVLHVNIWHLVLGNASETFYHFETTLAVGVVVIKPRYKIILVFAGMWAQEYGMNRQVTRPTLFFIIKASGTEPLN